MKEEQKSKLVRAVGPLGLTAIAVNGVVGAGIFVMPATVAALLGEASPAAYWVAGAAALLIALSFAEAGSLYERAGGPYVYAREAFGAFVGFEVGWMFLLGRVAGAAAIANAFAQYLGYLHPWLATPAGRAGAISGALFAIGAMNYVGVRYGAAIVNLLTVGKLLPLAVFAGVGLIVLDPRGFSLTTIPPFGPLREASLLLLFALGGFEFASVPSEEVINPRKSLPRALIAGVVLGTVIYVLAQIVCLGTLPDAGQDKTPMASAAARFLGSWGGLLMTLGAVLSTTGTNSTILLIGPRVLYALARDGQLPAVFGRVHARYRTPHVSVAVFALLTWAVALSGTFVQLAAMNAIARLLYSISTCASIPVLRKKMPDAEGRFTLPFGWTIPALGIAASAFLLTGMNRGQFAAGGIGMLVGTALYGVQRLRYDQADPRATGK